MTKLAMAVAAALLMQAAAPSVVRAQEVSPEALAAKAEADGSVIVRLHGSGVQRYACAAAAAGGAPAWTFQEPVATLTDDAGRAVGRHGKGPVWRMDDGSSVTGRAVLSRPGATAGDVPSLRLDVVERSGSGPVAGARTVLRVRTRGGALAGPCPTSGEVRDAPYTADYVFLR